jgi:hypothetical protein
MKNPTNTSSIRMRSWTRRRQTVYVLTISSVNSESARKSRRDNNYLPSARGRNCSGLPSKANPTPAVTWAHWIVSNRYRQQETEERVSWLILGLFYTTPLLSVFISAIVAMFSKTHPELDPLGSDFRKHVIYRYESIERLSRVLIVSVHRHQLYVWCR